MAAQLADFAHLGRAAEDAQIVVASWTGIYPMLAMGRSARAPALGYRFLALAFLLLGLGMLLVGAGVEVSPLAATAANIPICLGIAFGGLGIMPSVYHGLDRRIAVSAMVDGWILMVAGTTAAITMTNHGGDDRTDEILIPVLAAVLLASTGLPVIAALSMRIRPSLGGVWCAILAVFGGSWAWATYVDSVAHGEAGAALVTVLYSASVLALAYGWFTWRMEPSTNSHYLAFAQRLTDWLPIAAILVCGALDLVPHQRVAGIDPAPVGVTAVIILAVVRQRTLIVHEREASTRLAGEVEERAQTMLSLARLEPGETMEETARSIVSEALRLGGIDFAGVYVFRSAGEVVPIALAGPNAGQEAIAEPVEQARAMHMRACAGAGQWIDPLDGRRGAEAFSPIRWDDQIVGVVSMGSLDPVEARRLPNRLHTLTEFGVVSSAVLGPAMLEDRRLTDLRSQLGGIIERHAFAPVFQSVVRLRDRQVVGYEALTRFEDGRRPDLRFLEAAAVGMSGQLEMVCLADQLEAATWLPRGTWVSLNISPALATAVVPLVSMLERADRDVVLEITEHVEISDYGPLAEALALVRGRVRLAVDDAGAGYAGLRHILELAPQFVKLDLSLVRNIDSDRARQAMVAGMAHFAQDSGCDLIAEGIETQSELDRLIVLGVGYGQGYFFGRPAAVSWAADVAS